MQKNVIISCVLNDLELTSALELSAQSCPQGAVRTLPNTRARSFRMTGVNISLKLSDSFWTIMSAVVQCCLSSDHIAWQSIFLKLDFNVQYHKAFYDAT